MSDQSGADQTTVGIFPNTRWSIVLSAKDPEKSENPAAMEELCRIYWKPVYLFIRGRGKNPEDAEDLTQEFFCRLLDGHYLEAVEGPEKGRLRSFLCVVLKRFLADDYHRRMTQKRGGRWQAIPIDGPAAEACLAETGPDDASPDRQFDRRWALDLLAHAVEQLRSDYASAGKSGIFEALKSTINPNADGQPYAAIAERLEMTEGAVKVAVHRFRQRYRDCLRQTLRDTLQDPGDTEGELRYLRSLFAAR
jgi:RNA polymerase sigma-70 factor (ECF subfamily)